MRKRTPDLQSKVSNTELKVDIFGDPKALSAVKAAMTPECDNSKRCKMSLRTDRSGGKLSLIFKADDLISLRAGLNTNLRLASSALNSINATKK